MGGKPRAIWPTAATFTCLFIAHAAASLRGLQQQQQSLGTCMTANLVLPSASGEQLQSTAAIPTAINTTQTCVSLTGQSMLIDLDSNIIYRLNGTLVLTMSAQAPNACPDLAAASVAVRQFFLSRNLLPINTTWRVCCSGAGSDGGACPTTSFTIAHSPTLSFTDSSVPPDDWLVVQGFDIGDAARAIPGNLTSSLTSATTLTACKQLCAEVAGCASFQFLQTTTTSSTCSLNFNEPVQGSAVRLVACSGGGDCWYGFRLPGPCGVSASQTIMHVDKQWSNWRPELGGQFPVGATDDSVIWSQSGDVIPGNAQGMRAASVSECSCRCAGAGHCVGYTYQGSSKRCWLHDRLQPWGPTQPAAGNVIGRAYKGEGSMIPACSTTSFTTPNQVFKAPGTQRLSRTSARQGTTPQDCIALCSRDPSCMAADLMQQRSSDAVGLCQLYSNVSAGVEAAPARSVMVHNLLRMTRCEADEALWTAPAATKPPDWISATSLAALGSFQAIQEQTGVAFLDECVLLCQNTRGCAAVIHSPVSRDCQLGYIMPATQPAATAADSSGGSGSDSSSSGGGGGGGGAAVGLPGCDDQDQCVLVSRAQGDGCGVVATNGIIATGKIWRDWSPGTTLDDIQLVQGSRKQNIVTGSASDCACRCQATPGCTVYAFLGSNSTCWLFSRVARLDVDQHMEQDVAAATVIGRVPWQGPPPLCATTPQLTLEEPGTMLQPSDDTLIGRQPAEFPVPTPLDCNTACLSDSFCLGFSVNTDQPNTTLCHLYSSVGSTIVNDVGMQFGFVQRCGDEVRGAVGAGTGAEVAGTTTIIEREGDDDRWLALAVALGVSLGTVLVLALTYMGYRVYRRRVKGPPGGGAKAGEGITVRSGSVSQDPAGDQGRSALLAGWHPSTMDPSQPLYSISPDGTTVVAYAQQPPSSQVLMYPQPHGSLTGHQPPQQQPPLSQQAVPLQQPLSQQRLSLHPAPSAQPPSSQLIAYHAPGTQGAAPATQPRSHMVLTPIDAPPGPTSIESTQALQMHSIPSQLSYPPQQYTGYQLQPVQQYQVAGPSSAMYLHGPPGVGQLMPGQAWYPLQPQPPGSTQLQYGLGPGGQLVLQETGSYETTTTTTEVNLNIPGMLSGDPFILGVAPQYLWSTQIIDNTFQAVEEGITAARLAAQGMLGGRWKLPFDAPGPPPEQLTAARLREEVELMSYGMIGRGATAIVFKCLWPHKFGPKGLLAIKLLRDPFSHTSQSLESFRHEVNVLLKCRHPNVVRMYGYCLELPTVCIIMELLPNSLQRVIHGDSLNQPNQDPTVGPGTSSQPPQQPPPVIERAPSRPRPPPVLPSQRRASACMADELRGQVPVPGQVPVASFRAPSMMRSAEAVQQTRSALLEALDVPAGGKALHVPSGRLSNRQVEVKGPSSVQFLTPPQPTEAPPPLTIREVLQLAVDVSAGLAHLHAKPENRSPSTRVVPETHRGGSGSGDDERQQQEQQEEEGQGAVQDEELQRVVHRDLKPANILINSKNRAKISDFGLARCHLDTTMMTQHPAAGTLRYMAPELLRNTSDAAVTDKVDIYSLGLLLWELAKQEMPFGRLSELQVAVMVQTGERPPIPKAVSSVASITNALEILAYNTLVKACWQAEARRRPTAMAVHKALKKELQKHIDAQREATQSGRIRL